MKFITDFVESRLGMVTFWRTSMTGKHPPRGVSWLRTLGFCALIIALLQVMSGVALALHYTPSADLAYDSILAFEQDIMLGTFELGVFVRALHHFGASAFVIVLVLHMMRVFFTGAYKAPRELTWLTGVGLFVVVLGFGFTGYLLPWDQKAYFATKVGVEIAGKTPMIGAELREILAGGDTVGSPTLTRFYVIHVVLLPLALFGLLGLHLFLIQRHGVAAPGLPVGDEGEPGEPYFPSHVFKEVVAALAVTAVLVAVAATCRAPLEALAEPSDTGYSPRPDWYFLGLFQLLKLFEGPLEPLGTFYLPNLLLVGLLLLPFVDRTKHRYWRHRPFMITLGCTIILCAAGLTIAGAMAPRNNQPTLPHELGLTTIERQGYLLVRQLRCVDCHAHEVSDELTIGGSEKFPDAPTLSELDEEPDVLAQILADPKDMLSEDTEMPAFSHVPYEQRLAVGFYLRWLVDR